MGLFHRLRHAHRGILFRILSPFVEPVDLTFHEAIRERELDVVARPVPRDANILEIGAGAGWQARRLREMGFEVTAVEICDQDRAHQYLLDRRVFPITPDDGVTLPFPDESFSVVFSSNVLEHIPHVVDFQRELARVLAPDGTAIHVLPSSTWRFYTTLTDLIRKAATYAPLTLPDRHGERGDLFSEHLLFSRFAWRRLFTRSSWTIKAVIPNRLFYTGETIRSRKLSLRSRALLSRFFGSSCLIYVLQREPRQRAHPVEDS